MNATAVESIEPVAAKPAATNPLRLVCRSMREKRSLVQVGTACFGGPQPVVIAGPCSVESYEQTRLAADAVKAAGAGVLRGGAFKPRTSPYDFQGLGVEGLEILARIRRETGLPVVSEVMSTDDIDIVAGHVDMLQVGARNMQNFALLRRLSKCDRPILLKRGPASTVKEWLLAAEYLLAGGNDQVVLCERGVRSYDPELRNTFDLAGMALARQLTHLPVIADPSHATGRRDLIRSMSRAALAAGADGLMIEI
ncbi:MAG TPA: 3-deoxy-7-phosphoheptulonate synthase, partial [Acidobacteriaceae bacterium]|nr:3-deoxy-7-phosphoheptulonate synthase [Acidobacteriaceae bacterium]